MFSFFFFFLAQLLVYMAYVLFCKLWKFCTYKELQGTVLRKFLFLYLENFMEH